MIKGSWQYPLTESAQQAFDWFINATGYEERASALIRAKAVSANRYLSFLFGREKVLAYAENVHVMTDVSAEMLPEPLQFCRHCLGYEAKAEMNRAGRKIRVGVDVSSMNRTMAATLLSSIFAYREYFDTLELFYLPAEFYPPSLVFSPINQVGPVIPELSGFDAEPGLPIALIMGLGYEYGTAIGLMHQLEPQLTICLQGTGHDARFEQAVRQANLDFDFSTYDVQVTEYDLVNSLSAYRHIDSIVHSLVSNFRVVVVPMGPKLLASVLVLIGLQYFGKLAVWRVARHEQPQNARPSGTYIRTAIDLTGSSNCLDFSTLREMLDGKAEMAAA